MREPRSFLYVPGDRPDRFPKAFASGADAVIIDLEDSVAPSAKGPAREAAATWLTTGDDRPWIRVNSGVELAADLDAVLHAGRPAGVVVPKADPPLLDVVAAALEGGTACEVAALVETAAAVVALADIAAHPAVTRLGLGEADLGAELGIVAGPDEREWDAVRTTVVVHSAAARLNPPTGPVAVAIADAAGLRESTERLQRMGFGARAAIHPRQVAVINEVFTPGPHAVHQARRLLELAAAHDGEAVFVDDDGRMIDEAVLRSARTLLERAGARS